MANVIDEQISVVLWSNHLKRSVLPAAFYWRGRRYQISQVGLHHTFRNGNTLLHVFSVTDGINYYRLEMNAETLGWKLIEVETAD